MEQVTKERKLADGKARQTDPGVNVVVQYVHLKIPM